MNASLRLFHSYETVPLISDTKPAAGIVIQISGINLGRTESSLTLHACLFLIVLNVIV